MLFNVDSHYLLNYLCLNKGALDLFYTHYTEPKIAINCKNIKTMKYNGASVTLNLKLCTINVSCY